MPVLTPEQLEAIRKIIRDASTALAISTTGLQVTEADLQRLVAEGWVRAEDLQNVVLNSFELGRLKAALPQLQTMTWDQAQDHMRRHPVEMTAEEKLAAEIAQERAGDYCRNLGADLEKQLAGIVTEVSEARAEDMRALIREEVSQAVVDRKTSSELTTALRDATEDWGRDWKRVARTEMQLAHQQGHLENVRRRSGDEALMAKIPSPGACQSCLNLYLDKDGRPAVHPLSWWDAQGVNNVGRSRKDWKAVLGAVHPWCFPAGQRVTTARGQVPIECVTLRDLVLTAEGRWRRVRQLYRHYFSGDLVETAVSGARVRSTPRHLFRGVVGWQAAEELGEGSQIRRFQVLREAQPNDQPSVIEQKGQFALVLLCLDPAGVPVAAIDLNGHLAFFPAEVDQIAPADGVVDNGHAELAQTVAGSAFEFGVRTSGLPEQPRANLSLRLDATAASPVGRSGQRLTLFGGRELLADLHSFAARALLDPSLMQSLDDGSTVHADLLGYRLYGQVFLEVQAHEFVDVEGDASGHAETVAAHTAIVNSTIRETWSGYVYNLGVDEDESYVVEGFAVHNCRCELVEVPKGWEFDDGWNLVPAESTEKSRGGEDLMKAKAYGGPYIGPKGGKWADPQHTIPWHEKMLGVLQAKTPEEKASAVAELAIASHEHYRAAAGAMMRKMPEAHWRENVEIVRDPKHPEHEETKTALENVHQRIVNRINPSKAEQRKKAAALAKEKEQEEYEQQGVEVEEGTSPRELRGKKVWLYHGTSTKHLPHIRKEGLRTAAEHGRKQSNAGSTAARYADPNHVYLTARATGEASAEFYAQAAARKTGGQPVILRVLVDGDDLERDPDDQDISSGRYQYVTDSVTPEQIMEVDGKRQKTTLRKAWEAHAWWLERLEKSRSEIAQSVKEPGSQPVSTAQSPGNSDRSSAHVGGHAHVKDGPSLSAKVAVLACVTPSTSGSVVIRPVDLKCDLRYGEGEVYIPPADCHVGHRIDAVLTEEVHEQLLKSRRCTRLLCDCDLGIPSIGAFGQRPHLVALSPEALFDGGSGASHLRSDLGGTQTALIKAIHQLGGNRQAAHVSIVQHLEKARKLHYRTAFAGLPISIENRKGSIRRWYDPHAKRAGETKVQFPYGYIRLTEGTDGDHVDVYLGPDEQAPHVYVVHQLKAPDFKKLDEDKCMLGFASEADARKAYLAHYDDPRFLGSITTLTIEAFKKKLQTHKGELIKAFGGVAGLVPLDRPVGTMSTQGDPPKDRSDFAAHPVEGHYANPEVSKRQKRKRRRDRLPNVKDKPESLVAYQPGMAREKPVVDRGNPQDPEENRRRFEERLTEQTNARQGIVLRPQDLR